MNLPKLIKAAGRKHQNVPVQHPTPLLRPSMAGEGPVNLGNVLDNTIRRTLEHSKTQSCSTLEVEFNPTNPKDFAKHTYNRYELSESGDVVKASSEDGTVIYPIGSLSKLLIAICVCLVIEKKDCRKSDAHDQPLDVNEIYTRALKRCIAQPIDELPGNPRIRHLIEHDKGLPDMNRFLIGPENTLLLTKGHFLEVARLLNDEAPQSAERNLQEYSNGNYILLGILVEAYSGLDLADFIRKHILEKLDMSLTFIGLNDPKINENTVRAFPHIVDESGNLQVRPELEPNISDVVGIASLGVHSCTRDLGILFQALHEPLLFDSTNSLLTRDSVWMLRGREIDGKFMNDPGAMDDIGRWYGMGNRRTGKRLESGIQSVNEVIAPNEREHSRKHESLLPRSSDSEPPYYYCYSGISGTYSACFYINSDSHFTTVVLTNTLGHGDPTCFIASAILEARRELRLDKSSADVKKDLVRQAETAESRFQEVSSRWQKRLIGLRQLPDQPSLINSDLLVGRYESSYQQSLIISVDGQGLRLRIKGDSENCTRPMELRRVSPNRLHIVPQYPVVDVMQAWQDLTLTIEVASPLDVEHVRVIHSTFPCRGEDLRIQYELVR